MKTQFYSLLIATLTGFGFSGCNSSAVATLPAVEYPRYAELQKGNYGTRMYANNQDKVQQVYWTYTAFCDTVQCFKTAPVVDDMPIDNSAATAPYLLCVANKCAW